MVLPPYNTWTRITFLHRESLSVDITALAQEVYDILSARDNPVPRTAERERRKKSQFFINSSNKKAKSVTLHIQGLDSTVSGLVNVLKHSAAWQ